MVSRLAKAQIEKWWSEGLRPTVDDIVLMNNLGLQVERGSEMFEFSVCPRIAFLGDTILREPTVAKHLWIDEVQRLFADTVESRIYIVSYALATPDCELPSIQNRKAIERGVVKFRDEVLLKFTETQILSAIDYCMNGNRPDLAIPPDATDEERRQQREVYEIPDETRSVAKQLLLEAMSSGIQKEVADYALLEDLERMVLVAAMQNGIDVMKNRHGESAGRFYAASGRIHKRLTDETEKSDDGKTGLDSKH